MVCSTSCLLIHSTQWTIIICSQFKKLVLLNGEKGRSTVNCIRVVFNHLGQILDLTTPIAITRT